MENLKFRTLSDAAKRALEPKKQDMQRIVLFYLLIITSLSLVASALTLLLSDRIAGTGGLRGMGLRSVLSTAQTLLPLVQTLVFLGLQMGYHDAALGVSRDKPVSLDTLWGGFRRFLPLLRVNLLQGMLYGAAGFLCLYLATYIFLLLPASEEFVSVIMPVFESASVLSGEIVLDDATLTAATAAMKPFVWIFLPLFLILFIPMFYHYRLAIYRLLDHGQPRAFRALMESRALMRRSRLTLLKLDLHLWWYYLAQLLLQLVCYGDVALALVGITLPFSDTAGYYLFLVLSLALQFVFQYLVMNRVGMLYAVFYDRLLTQKKQMLEQRRTPPAAAKTHWSNTYENNNP